MRPASPAFDRKGHRNVAAKAAASPPGFAALRARLPTPATALGNQAHLHRLQAKLAVGAVNDPLEREADAAADQVMRMADPRISHSAPPTLRRKCEECEEEEKKKGELQRKETGAAATVESAPPIVAAVLASPGKNLDPATQEFMESRFGADFARVRVHTGSEAAVSAAALSARAYTVGTDVVFGAGQFDPSSQAGRHLLAHELAHVVQGGEVVRRDGDVEDPLTEVRLALIKAKPPVFRATFAFTKTSYSFDVTLEGNVSRIGLREGTQPISASEFHHPNDPDYPVGGVYFTLPDQGDAMMWFNADKENIRALVRANAYLQGHKPVPLKIIDATKTISGDSGGEGEKAEAPEPKFIDAEAWLAKEMLPAVKASLAADHPSAQVGALIPYRSTAIQKEEGPDISLIQVDKPGSKAIAGHVRVDRRKWVGQDSQRRDAYVHEIASAIIQRLADSARKDRLQELDAENAKKGSGETFPAWAIKLKEKVEKKLGEARAAWPAGQAPKDIPDRLTLVHVGDMVHFQLFLEREASNAPGKTVWQIAIMSPWLDESMAEDVDALVRTVREKTAQMRDHDVKLVEKSDEHAPAIILLEPIPAEIKPKNLNADGTSILGATNRFEMDVRIDIAFSFAGGNDLLNMVGYSNQLGLGHIPITWKVAQLTEYNAEDLARAPRKQPAGAPPVAASDLYFDLANRKIDQQTKIGLAMHRVDVGAIMRSAAYPVVDTTHGVLDDLEYRFPTFATGVYLVVAETTPRPIVTEKYREIFAPSRAVLPVRVTTSEALAAETVSQTPDEIAEKEKAKADPSLTEAEKIEIDADIAKLKRQEGMTQLGVTQEAEEDIDRQTKAYSDLRNWLIADQAVHASISGTATEDPLLVRMSVDDRLHDTHLFATFQQLYLRYGELALDRRFLSHPIDSETGQYSVLNKQLALLAEQKKESHKLQERIQGQDKNFKEGTGRQTVATLVISETGTVVPLLLLVGEIPEKDTTKHRYKIIDLTFSSMIPNWSADDNTYATGSSSGTPEEALHDAFVLYGEKNEYEAGTIYYRFAGESLVRSVPNVVTAGETLKKWAMPLAILGMIASMVATAGATTPAVAAVISAITLANAALAIYMSSEKLLRRSSAGTLHLDIDAALDVLNIIASVVGFGALARARQLGQIARTAEAAGNLARTATALAKIEQLGRNMLIFDTAVLGATAVLTGWKVSEDVAKIKALHLPPEKEEELLKEIAADAVMQGAMMAFQSVMLARTHLEMYRNQVEASGYKSLEDRSWVDEDGRLTDLAPPRFRATVEGKSAPVGEKPPVSLDSDLPRVKAAAERGEVKKLATDPEHDLEILFHDENDEPHSFKRRREDDIWCRYSNPFCFISDKDIQRIVDEIGDLEGVKTDQTETSRAARGGGKGVPGKSWGRIGAEGRTLTQTIEATIKRGVADLKKIGTKGLLPHIYGTKLHAVVADLFRGMKLPRGWRAIVDQPLRKSGILDPKFEKMTVRKFLNDNAPWLIPGDPSKGPSATGVPESLLSKKIGDIEPDLVLIAPDGTKIVWDLAPSENPEHLAKTIVYELAIDGGGGRAQIGETYYHPERGLELDPVAQNRFRGSAADSEGVRLKLTDEKARALARRFFGKGKPVTPDLPSDPKAHARVVAAQKRPGAKPPEILAAGYSGAVELVTSSDTVVGEYLDPKTGAWVETTNFSIHYSEEGVFIRPEAP